MSNESLLSDLYFLNPSRQVQSKLQKEGFHLIAEFNAYVTELAGDHVGAVKKIVEIQPELGTKYLKVEVRDTTMMIVDPLQLVKALARPFVERSGVPFNPTLEV